MKSIDNLREWWRDRFPVMDRQLGCDFREHIDAIEREVEELRDRDYRNGREDAGGAAEFADRLCRASERREDVTLWGVDYMPLPVDADGVSWHVGDMTENGNVVNGMTIDFHGWHFTGTRNDIDPAIHRHYVPKPTVEDVLREFAAQVTNGQRIHGAIEIEQAVAECAAKLRLTSNEE